MNDMIDWTKEFERFDWKELEKENKVRQEKAEKQRQNHFNNIECPVCKSTKKVNVVKTDSNKVYGPGYSSWVTEDYLICQNCGVMYKDLKKPKENG